MAGGKTGQLARIIVRRGALRRFHRLTRDAANLPVRVEWDRREGERRTGAPQDVDTDKRKSDRRQQPPFTWDQADFVVIPPEDR